LIALKVQPIDYMQPTSMRCVPDETIAQEQFS